MKLSSSVCFNDAFCLSHRSNFWHISVVFVIFLLASCLPISSLATGVLLSRWTIGLETSAFVTRRTLRRLRKKRICMQRGQLPTSYSTVRPVQMAALVKVRFWSRILTQPNIVTSYSCVLQFEWSLFSFKFHYSKFNLHHQWHLPSKPQSLLKTRNNHCVMTRSGIGGWLMIAPPFPPSSPRHAHGSNSTLITYSGEIKSLDQDPGIASLSPGIDISTNDCLLKKPRGQLN